MKYQHLVILSLSFVFHLEAIASRVSGKNLLGTNSLPHSARGIIVPNLAEALGIVRGKRKMCVDKQVINRDKPEEMEILELAAEYPRQNSIELEANFLLIPTTIAPGKKSFLLQSASGRLAVYNGPSAELRGVEWEGGLSRENLFNKIRF